MNARKFAMLAAPLAASVALAANPAGAETIKMVAVAGAPPQVSNVKALHDFFIPLVDKRIAASGKDFKIEWTQAYASTLANLNEVFEAVEQNIGQVGVILKNFEESKLALDQVSYMVPFTDATPEQAIAIDTDMREKIPALNKQYTNHNQVVLTSSASAGSDMFTTFPLKGVEGLKGHKIGASGAMGQYLRGTGAVVVNSAMMQSYTSIRNGVYEGYPISVTLVVPFRTYQVAKYHLAVDFGATPTTTLTVNEGAFKKLPDFVQKIFRETAEDYWKGNMKIDDERYKKFVGILKKSGVKTTVLSQDGRRKWAMLLPNIAQEWAHARDKDGLPGSLVLKTYMDELRSRHIFVAREWDKSS